MPTFTRLKISGFKNSFMKKVFLSLFLSFTVWGGVQAQYNIGGFPKSITNSALIENQKVPLVKLAAPDFEKAKKEDEVNVDRPGKFRVALAVNTDITLNNTGTFTYLPDGSKIWRAKIAVPTSVGIKPLYKAFQLPKGVTYFISNENGKQLVGGYDYRSNSPEKTIGHEMIQGDIINLEMDIDAGVNMKEIEFQISQLYGVYRGAKALVGEYTEPQGDVVAKPTDYDLGSSDACQINAMCPTAARWQQISKTTAHIWITDGTSGGFCSGNLINNTNKDCTPYFLTAMHCDDGNGKTNAYFDHWEFTFGLQTPLCGGGGTIVKNRVLTGANFAARSDYPASQIGLQNPAFTGDWLLLRLRDPQSQLAGWDTYLGGWDRNLTSTDSLWVSFHHPSGDVKKFSKSKPLTQGTFNQNTIPNTHWQVAFTEGGSQPGSSGSCLFTASNGRIIGDLSGGSGSSPCASNRRALYSKLSRNWEYPEGDGTAQAMLKPWLDPANTGAMTTEMAKVVGGANCGDTPFTLEPSDVKDVEELSNGIVVYPNPSNGMVHMKFNLADASDLTVAVVNILGAKVGSYTVKAARNGDVVLDMNSYANGIYMLQISSAKVTVSKKVVLNR